MVAGGKWRFLNKLKRCLPCDAAIIVLWDILKGNENSMRINEITN